MLVEHTVDVLVLGERTRYLHYRLQIVLVSQEIDGSQDSELRLGRWRSQSRAKQNLDWPKCPEVLVQVEEATGGELNDVSHGGWSTFVLLSNSHCSFI